ncbi:MAG TPA: ankyrin repeat domain-containing protein [Bryobacteraceae bacterium]|nr:ankyrin repeat domain-containing protein [Bryobacteraceae bacterium]
MGNRILVSLVLLGALPGRAADLGPDLLNDARRGQTEQVRTLLDKGAPVDSRDRVGRTALMLAAQHGHSETVSLLLAKGAKADARDEEGLTAYALAFLSTGKARDKVLGLLPAPPKIKLMLDATAVLDSAYNSCFMTPKQLAERIRQVEPESLLVGALRDVAANSDSRLFEFVTADGDAVLTLRVRPEAMCVQQQSSDNLQMQVDVRLVRSGNHDPIWEKTFGGGLKGLKARVATNPVQYGAAYEEWSKAEAPGIYSGLINALLKAAP